MIDSKTFYSIPNWLDLEGHRVLVVIEKKPAYWHCGEIGHLYANCQRKKVPVTAPDRMRNPLPTTMAKGKKEAPVVLSAVGTTVLASIGGKIILHSILDFSFANCKGVRYHSEVKVDSTKRSEPDRSCRSLITKSSPDR